MKKQTKIALKILLFTIIIALIMNVTPVDATLEVNGFGAEPSTTGNKVQSGANIVIGIIQAIGIAAAIIMLIMVAIKYLTAAPGEKADIKKSIIIYVIGAVLLFAATGILGIIQGFANEIAPAEATNPSVSVCNTCGGKGLYREQCPECGVAYL